MVSKEDDEKKASFFSLMDEWADKRETAIEAKRKEDEKNNPPEPGGVVGFIDSIFGNGRK